MLLAPVPALLHVLLSKKLAPAEKNSTDMSAASSAFCISEAGAQQKAAAAMEGDSSSTPIPSTRFQYLHFLHIHHQLFKALCWDRT